MYYTPMQPITSLLTSSSFIIRCSICLYPSLIFMYYTPIQPITSLLASSIFYCKNQTSCMIEIMDRWFWLSSNMRHGHAAYADVGWSLPIRVPYRKIHSGYIIYIIRWITGLAYKYFQFILKDHISYVSSRDALQTLQKKNWNWLWTLSN
jgi:hypothetical protein